MQCYIDGCTRPVLARGICKVHYDRRSRHGSTEAKAPARGADHPRWTGEKASADAGHKRARKLFGLRPCEECGKPAHDRHHKDGNTANNRPSNVVVLCRRCHMKADGRLAKLAKYPRRKVQPEPCVRCGRKYKPRRKGLCGRCYDRDRRSNVKAA